MMKVGEEILIKAKVIGFCSPMYDPTKHRAITTAAMVYIEKVFGTEFSNRGNGVTFWADPENFVLIAEKK
mgnify:FL=1